MTMCQRKKELFASWPPVIIIDKSQTWLYSILIVLLGVWEYLLSKHGHETLGVFVVKP